MISKILLKVAFSSRPRTSPTLPDSSRVEKAIKEASGIMASQFRKKTTTSGAPKDPAAIPIGTETSRTFM